MKKANQNILKPTIDSMTNHGGIENARYFYHGDHLGSSSWISDKDGNALQYISYLPYGQLFWNLKTTSYDASYKFIGKERDSETGFDYFGARYYSSPLGVWLSVDPLADKRAWSSPYSYCQNNPIGRVDVSGALDDEYTVDEQGNTQLVEKTKDNFDVIYTKESWDNSNIDNSITVDKGVLGSKKTNSGIGTDENKYTFDLYTIKGDDKSKELFEFLSNNTEVEWSQTLIGLEKNQTSILSTSHDKDTEAGQGYLFAYGYTIRGHNHSHPYSNIPSSSDKSWANTVNLKFPNAILQILHKGNYYQYDKQGLLFNSPEIIINPE